MAEPSEDPVLSQCIKTHADFFRAPAGLRDDISALIDKASRTPTAQVPPDGRGWRKGWLFGRGALALGGTFALGLLIGAIALSIFLKPSTADMTLVALSSDHARALVTGTIIDVPSSDRHTVKPWLSKEVGVSPNVVDLTNAGYPLKGGRRGYLGPAVVPVMVYGFKNHVIDLYALPDTATPGRIASSFSVNGFHCLSWQQDGFTYVAVSDVDQTRLEDLEAQLKTRWADPGP